MNDMTRSDFGAHSNSVEQLIFAAVDELNQQLSPAEALAKSSDTALFGEGSTIDSMSLVTLIVCVEERLHSEYGRAITLASEKAMSRKRSPFLSIATLTEYIQECLDEGNSNELKIAA